MPFTTPRSSRTGRRRSATDRRLFAGISLLVGTAVGLLVVEICLRMFSLAPSLGVATVTEAEFERVPGIFGPGQQLIDHQLAALPFSVTIDSLGYRGQGFPVNKADAELRILSIGDSFTYGDFVDDDETLPSALERHLAQQCERPVRVINAGVGGSTISLQAHMVHRAWRLTPDVVMLVFSENDVADLQSDMWSELAENRKAKSRFPLSWGYPFLRRLALWHLGLEVRSRLRTSVDTPVEDRVASRGPITRGEHRGEYAQRLGELASDVRGRGLSFVIVLFPSHWTARDAGDEEQLRWAEEVARANDLSVVNLLDSFRASRLPVDSLYLLPHDGHPSPRGYELAASWVADRLAMLGTCGADEGS